MASAIIGKMVDSGFYGANISVIDPNSEKREKLHADFGVNSYAEAGPWIEKQENILLAVKPQQLPEAIRQIMPFTNQTAAFISIAAGVRTSDLAAMLQTERIVRVMPNTPIKVGLGVCGIYLATSDPELEEVTKNIFEPCGEIIWCEREEMIESITAISGSGPAYVFFFMEALERTAVKFGFNPEQARALAVATVRGASELAKESSDSLSELRAKVTSKGGTTFEAIKVMEDHNFLDLMQEAMQACKNRAIELGEAFHQSISHERKD